MNEPNALGSRILEALLASHPPWVEHVRLLDGGDVEVAVPAPAGSRAGSLAVFTSRGEDIWIRFAPPHMRYAVESEQEMKAVVEAILRDEAFFVVITDGDEWVETGLYRPGEEPVLEDGHVANTVSWSGRHDRVVTHGRVSRD